MTGQHGDDRGFTLIEVLVSVFLISMVMASLTSFYSLSTRSTSRQIQTQSAIQLAGSAIEQSQQMPGEALLEGRAACAVNQQWLAAPDLLENRYLTSMTHVADSALDTFVCPTGAALQTLLASTNAALPLVTDLGKPESTGPRYTQNIYIGACYQANGLNALPGGASGDTSSCVPNAIPSGLPMLRIVIAITWPSAHCPAASCSYVTASIVPLNTVDLTFG
jgi:prepilin-type N-terminal cleavage/methylation domain-containing protein